MVEFSTTKHTLTSALTAGHGKDTAMFSACRDDLIAAADALLSRAQRAGAVRPDITAMDLLRLCHAVALMAERAADVDQAERMLSLMVDGLLITGPVAGSRREC
jgi:hypothetical protein